MAELKTNDAAEHTRISLFASLLRGVYKLSGAKKAFGLPEEEIKKVIEKQNRSRGVFAPADRKAYYETVTVNGFPCLIVRNAPEPSERAILYFFGGGMVIGPDRGDLPVMRKLMRGSGCDVWFPFYPLCMEHCITETYDMVYACYHCAPYIGLGKAENAVNAVNEAFAERGIALPLTSGQTVTEESRLADGIAAQKSIFGVQIDAMRAAAPEDQKKIQDDLSAYCFGDFYTRRFLTIPERELLTFAILAAQGGCEPQVRAHVGGNAAVGNGRETLLAALTVCLPYIGFPRTLNALSCINEVLP